MRRSLATSVFVVALSTVSTAALAQTAPASTTPGNPAQTPDSTADQPQAGGLEDIIVTATRRSENLQNVPVAVSAVSASELKRQGVFDTTDLNHSLPNLQVSSPYGKQQPNFSVRGVGVGTEFNANAASPIGVYVDEVYQAFRASHGQQLYDLNQIEVVRGPQGTLYGRNTTGGAINFITHAPGLQGQNGFLTLGYGSYNRFASEGAVEVTPVEGVLGIRLAGTYEDSDPYLHNVTPAGLNASVSGGASGLNRNSGVQPGGAKNYALRLTVRFKPSDTVDLSLKVYGGESDGGTEATVPFGQSKNGDTINYTNLNFLLGGLFAGLAPAGLVPASYSANANGLTGTTQIQNDTLGRALTNAFGAVFNAKIKLSDHLRLVSITGYDDGRYLQSSTDCDSSPLRLCALGYGSKYHAFNQDVRFDYSSDKLKLIVGGYYGRDVITTDNKPDFFNFLRDVTTAVGLPSTYFNPGGAFNGAGLSATSLPTGITATQHFLQVRTSYAIYGEGSYQITPTVKLTLGARYTADTNKFENGLTTYYDDAGNARLITVSDFQQGGAYAAYFLQPVRNEAGAIVIPSFQGLGIPLPGGLNQQGKSNRVSGRAILDWKPTDETLVYASYSRGYRAGTFNGLAYGSANQDYFVKPEQVNAYEVGFKTRWLDNRLQINGAFFYYDYKGQQGQVVDNTATANLVSLDGTLKGLEIDAQLAITPRLRLSASFGYIDSAYSKGDCPANAALIPKFPAQLGSCVVSSAGPVSVAGNPFPYAAKESANAAIDWDVADIGEGKVNLHVDGNFTGRFYYDSFKDYSRGPLVNVTTGRFANGEGNYVIGNARITFTHGNYSVAAFVKNFTDHVYYPFGIALENLFGNDYRVRAEPRTFGGEVTARF
ncbi:MAG: TonB-dependent receptor [Bradyrhizobium sp.]|nr:TonB-dependent receptor [Bradyrhizobium sp.]